MYALCLVRNVSWLYILAVAPRTGTSKSGLRKSRTVYTAIVMRYKLTFSLPHNIFFTFWFVSIRFIYLTTLYIGRSGGIVRWAFRGSTSIPRSYMRIVTVATSHQVYGASGSLCTCFSVSRSELILQSFVHEGTASDPWWSDGEYNVTIRKKKNKYRHGVT